ncbi:hypothetical protein EVAR_38234_1 [Eumeta japonica]|uniref:Uncharacterized protein n=1 Tax=Eumeta variegata TaxID=151549 RepID=A0A4C1XGV3_EUMVA|nr:hypothetical protein EVAR_38234_1 [Eumeta japonica]
MAGAEVAVARLQSKLAGRELHKLRDQWCPGPARRGTYRSRTPAPTVSVCPSAPFNFLEKFRLRAICHGANCVSGPVAFRRNCDTRCDGHALCTSPPGPAPLPGPRASAYVRAQ